MNSPAPSASATRLPPLFGLIGNTPLVALPFRAEGVTIHAKAEFMNPSGSIKDRLAAYVLLDARARGLLRPDSIILECTSGNTGIALAMVGTALGHQVRILMSDTASVERRHLMRHFGAELQLFKADRGYLTGIEMSEAMAAADPRIFLTCQFANPLNAQDHAENTGPEILRQLPGPIDAFVSGYGTGGTLNGTSRALRAAHPGLRVVAMEPAEAAMLSGESPCCHSIEGVAGGYMPPLLQGVNIDWPEKVSSPDALAMTRRLAREFGLLVGTSSGANLVAALRTAHKLPPGARIVTVLCDRAERYYSTKLFSESSMGVPSGIPPDDRLK
ncbi:MAG: cysteine synthase family protein [Candidatus Didemnitutus sp.]|nr:cysteine synthase family protein [Candidatus Didemnitutus sp.]